MKQAYAIIITLFLFHLHTMAGVIRVGKGGITTIREGLNVAKAGDTIMVYEGLYKEQNLVVTKPVTLKGVNYPVIDGEGKYEIITIKASHVIVEGLVVQHSGRSGMQDFAGIKIVNARYVTVRDNILKENYFGIFSQFGFKCVIINNKLSASGTTEQQSGNGIHCWKSDSMQVIGNTISGHRDGIYFEFVTNSLIWKNRSEKNIRYGLHFMFSNNDSYISNIFRDNGAGVAVMFTKGVKMFNNYFQENRGEAAYGILLKEISDSHIEGNHFENNTMGIYMEGSNRIIIKRNQFLQNGWAVKIQASCEGNNLQRNNFIGNTFDIGTNGSLVLNTFDYNYWSKYEGYDLNKDRLGDVPFRPVSIYSMIVETNPPAMMLFRSLIVGLLDKTEKLLPGITPEIKDNHPLMKPIAL